MLPIDIISEVIDHLGSSQHESDSFKALLNCALVSRTWIPRSRYQLFRDVSIGVIPLASSAGSNHLRDGREFLEILSNTHATILQMETLLVAGGDWICGYPERFRHMEPLFESVKTLVVVMWRPFSYVDESLDFTGAASQRGDLSDVGPRLLQAVSIMAQVLQAVTTLTFQMTSAPIKEVLRVVEQFHHLEELTIVGALRSNFRLPESNGPERPAQELTGPPLSLRTIRFKYCPPMNEVIVWLRRNPPSLQAFHAIRLYSRDLGLVLPFLSTMSDSMRNLTLDSGVLNTYMTGVLGKLGLSLEDRIFNCV
jgi:hypothetical protein